MNQKGLEFTGVGPIEDIQLTDFFGDDRLWVSSVIAAARSVGCASSKSTCGLVDPGGGDDGSVGLYRNVRIIDLNLSVGITNPRRLNLIFIPSVTVKHCILYKFTLIFIYIFYK